MMLEDLLICTLKELFFHSISESFIVCEMFHLKTNSESHIGVNKKSVMCLWSGKMNDVKLIRGFLLNLCKRLIKKVFEGLKWLKFRKFKAFDLLWEILWRIKKEQKTFIQMLFLKNKNSTKKIIKL